MRSKAILRKIPDYEKEINHSKGIAAADKVAPTYQESLQYPSLNVRGLQSGWVREERRTIIPSSAIAEIDIRLVLESNPERMIKLLRDHIADQGYYITIGKPTSVERNTHNRIASFTHEISYRAFRTDFNTDIGKWLSDAVTAAQGEEPIKIRTSGGSIPISPFVNKLNIPAVSVGTVQRDNNQHSPNENLRLGKLCRWGQDDVLYIDEQPGLSVGCSVSEARSYLYPILTSNIQHPAPNILANLN